MKKKREKKLRIYSYGGRIIYLSTTKYAKNDVLKDDKYLNYAGEDNNTAEKYRGNHSYGCIDKKEVGFRHYESLESDIDYSKKGFFQYIKNET